MAQPKLLLVVLLAWLLTASGEPDCSCWVN
jgi:hypothetical protein